MLLAIDCGNTNIVFALYKNPQDTKTEPLLWRYQTLGKTTADEYASWLIPLLQNEGIAFKDITDVIVASVVPDVNFNLKRLFEKYIGIEAEFIKPDGSNAGLKVSLASHVKIGADQIVNAVAAIEKYGAPCIVIDFGTATTFEIVNKDQEFCGGIIMPGVNLSVEALHNAAALLPHIAIERPKQVMGYDTISAMQSGLFWGYVSMIEGMAKRVCDEMGVRPTFIATGGLSNLFMDAIDLIDHAAPLLTLEGLRIIHCRNQPQAVVKSIA